MGELMAGPTIAPSLGPAACGAPAQRSGPSPIRAPVAPYLKTVPGNAQADRQEMSGELGGLPRIAAPAQPPLTDPVAGKRPTADTIS